MTLIMFLGYKEKSLFLVSMGNFTFRKENYRKDLKRLRK